jgi:hypothetical protein
MISTLNRQANTKTLTKGSMGLKTGNIKSTPLFFKVLLTSPNYLPSPKPLTPSL